MLICCSIAKTGNAQKGADQILDFWLDDQGQVDGSIFRAPSVIPVQGYYVSSQNAIYLSFAYDMGDVKLLIVNTNTGECISEAIPTNSGVQVISLGSNCGHYCISIVGKEGRLCYAELIL